MNIRYLTLLALPIVAFASGHEGAAEGGTDFWWRLFNFLVFAAIIYKLVASKIVDFFKGREQGIAGELSAIQDKLKEAKAQKAEALAKVDEAENSAGELLQSAKNEAKLMSDKIGESLEHDKIQLEKSFNDRVEIETKKMKEEVVSEVIEEMFSSSDMKISNDDLLNIIKKKVA
jgi:F-type H+-transporting ATPase subunit b